MYGNALGYSFALAATMECRTEAARKALLQPGVSVKFLGADKDTYNIAVALLEVTSANGSVQKIQATPHDIDMIRKDPEFSSSLHTVMVQASWKTEKFYEELKAQQEKNWEETVSGIKTWVKRHLTF